MITITCKNNGAIKKVPAGSNLEEILALLELDMPYGVTSCKVNNKVEGLHYVAFYDKDLEYLDITSASGMRTYTRSLFFVLFKAFRDLYPEGDIRIETPVSQGYYCKWFIDNPDKINIKAIKARMQEIIKANIPFHRITCHTEEAIELFNKFRLKNKAKLLKSYGKLYTNYYLLDDTPDYFYGSLLTNTGKIHLFDIAPYYDGLLIRIPDSSNPQELLPLVKQEKMFEVFEDHHKWQNILGISTIGELNEAIENNKTFDLINVSEALQERKIIEIADSIRQRPQVKVILISGPSSSGKTTFSKRLSVHLSTVGLKPFPISLDNYFVDRTMTPLDKNGDYDYEHLNALNIPILTEDINALLRGEKVHLSHYNFQTGKSEKDKEETQIDDQTILILEGIHALNPELTKDIPDLVKYKIYASALTTILLDNHNYIPTSDNRLLRRIVRDKNYRGYSASQTIARWPSVQAGERKWIFPFQENADVMFNSALLFELAAISDQALPMLEHVTETEPEFSEAYRLRKFLSYIKPIPLEGLPPTSLLREFLGGSTFRY